MCSCHNSCKLRKFSPSGRCWCEFFSALFLPFVDLDLLSNNPNLFERDFLMMPLVHWCDYLRFQRHYVHSQISTIQIGENIPLPSEILNNLLYYGPEICQMNILPFHVVWQCQSSVLLLIELQK